MNKLTRCLVCSGLFFYFSFNLSANGLNLNGIGSKAIAMGGAFIGLADDYSAVYWNPAGLVQMKESNLAAFGTFVVPKASYQFDPLQIDAQSMSKVYPSGALGYFKPLSKGMVVGILGYVPSGLGTAWDGQELKALSNNASYNWSSQVALFSISPVIAMHLSQKLSLGASLNFSYGMFKMYRPGLGQYQENIDGFAIGMSLGLLYKPSEMISFGLTCKTPTKLNFSGSAEMEMANLLNLPKTADIERRITWPLWLGVGLAFKPIMPLTITFDLQYTNWKKLDTVPANLADSGWSDAFGPDLKMNLKWMDTWQIRTGFQLYLSKNFNIRGGYYYDATPGSIKTQTILLPTFNFNVITAGFGYKFGRMNIDFSMEYAMGEKRDIGLNDVDPGSGMPGIHQFKVFVPNFAVTFNL
jgi:long-chain fatty acid transport protein